MTLERGDTARITATVVDHRGVALASPSAGVPSGPQRITWTSSNPSIADISRSGLIVGQKEGEVTITATTGHFSRTSTVSVQSQGKSVTISPKVDTLATVGHTSQLSVTVLNGSGKEQTNPSVSWTSLEPSIASVDAKGLVTAIAAGAALITASAQGQTDSARIVVLSGSSATSPTVASVVVEPSKVEAAPGEKQQYSATVKDGSGEDITGASLVWSSGDPEVATVDSKGMVTAKTAGSASIRASVDGKSGSGVIHVGEYEGDSPEPEAGSEPDFGAIVRGIRPRGYGQGSYALVQPASGAKMYYVATTGSDSNPGTSSSPFRSINKAAQVAVAGDVVTIRNGTYRESVLVKNGGTADKRIVFQAENRGGVVLTGGEYQFIPANWTSGERTTGAIYVTVRGLIFREYSTTASDAVQVRRAAVGMIRGWTVEDCLFDAAGYDGVRMVGGDVTVVRSTFQYAYNSAITAFRPTGSTVTGFYVRDTVLRGNHTRSDPLEGAVAEKVAKFWRTDGAVIDNIESYENNGPGFWFDHGNRNYVVRNSYFHRNKTKSGRGLFIEINWAPGLIENNVFAHNEAMGLSLANSQGITVRSNLFVSNDRAIVPVYADRGTQYPLKDIVIQGNYFKGWTGPSAIHPGGSLLTTPARMNITADGNTYDPGSSAALTYWANTGWIRSISDMQSKLGWEQNGRITAIAWPQ